MLETSQRIPERAIDRRRRQTTAEILEAAWSMCRQEGLAGLSLRALATEVGMRAPSLYSYFDSKHAIYDAMFKQGYEQISEVVDDPDDLALVDRDAVKEQIRRSFRFCTEDPVRYQLMFQRTIPGFEPSAASYAIAIDYLDRARRVLIRLGIDSDEALDVFTALFTGLTSQQIANDPGGERWARLLDDALDMFFDHFLEPNDDRSQP